MSALIFAFSGWARPAGAQTFKPQRDADIIEVLPRRTAAYVPAAQRALKAALRQDPHNVGLAVKLAQELVARGRETADPRAYGQAEAALEPWWGATDLPPDVRFLRASILQFNHRFGEALADLDQYLTARPDDTSARLMQATVAMVTGDYALAEAACARLQTGRDTIIPLTCNASIEAMQGKPGPNYERLRLLVEYLRPSDPAVTAWVYGTLGDMAARAGHVQDAEAQLTEALRAAPTDLFATVTLCDLLLQLGRNDEVIARLADRTDQDALLLRLALAEKRAKAPKAQEHADELAARFAAEKARGSRPHLREEAYFALYIQDDRRAAATLAEENWQTQKEPVDARLLAEARR